MNPSDLRALRDPLIVMIVVLAACFGLIYYLSSSLDTATRELAKQQSLLRDARTRLSRSGDEKQVIVRYLDDYESLQKLGFVGEEQRINWLEGLRLTNQQAQLFGVDYQIGAQQPYPYAGELDPGQLTLHQSLMKISFRLLHEGDLLRFLGTLAQQGAGFFSVNQCLVERIDAEAVIRFQPTLRANCELAWITVRPAVAGEKKS